MAENNNKQENIILCGANSYQQKYYFNEKFKLLPENIKKELQIMCVLFTEDVAAFSSLNLPGRKPRVPRGGGGPGLSFR